MNNYTVKSKIYCEQSRKEKAVIVVVNIAVIVAAIYFAAQILLNGVKIGSVSGCIISLFAASRFRRFFASGDHYEFCILSIEIDNETLIIEYTPNFDKKILVKINTIRSIEYSDQLKCMRLIADYTEISGEDTVQKSASELLLYIDYDENIELYKHIEELSGKTTSFVDRG